MEEKKFYTVTQAAAKLGVSAATLYSWLHSGKILEPERRDPGGRRRFSDEEIEKILRPSPPTRVKCEK